MKTAVKNNKPSWQMDTHMDTQGHMDTKPATVDVC